MPDLFQKFEKPFSEHPVPERFTFPFYYDPHPLSLEAARLLQEYLKNQTDFEHNFGLNEGQSGMVIGKMFGVLVVKNEWGELGYLWAFSGKLADQNHWPKFVPTVYDMLEDNGYFKVEERILNNLNLKIENLENSEDYKNLLEATNKAEFDAYEAITTFKQSIKNAKKERALYREKHPNLNDEDALQLIQVSQLESIRLRQLQLDWKDKIASLTAALTQFEDQINLLKEERRNRSASLQQQLFSEYAFLNQYGTTKSLQTIFQGNPPAGAGECAAPKLLHYAFQNKLRPLAMAEFWWGQSPKSEVRKHGQFYPACTGKCEPILGHMLEGIPLEDNPFLVNLGANKSLEIIYEDEWILAVNKPTDLLSTPGKNIADSVYTRLKGMYPQATGPLIVHRLDMATSGILLCAKDEQTYKLLQAQFIKRKIQKKYTALLSGLLNNESGIIELPLRLDIDNRPFQIVCHEYGKPAITHWKKVKTINNQTVVEFTPITGRTHQLRVHAAHVEGLHTPIVGDDLYGTKGSRLHLHATQLNFWHPYEKKEIMLFVPAPFVEIE
ncbi:RluA family pseudouridine synthase [Flavobacterium stagni]|uniref:RluA family pseudouridine synthase n=1 Tax=Flavobacterium stagni TaxID=2506421 RepID=A0A4Q1K9X3_9FLAO|nr:RluA family pseudouridine synthase [Flavobacterium stagni]RXR23017.1 RluA family pseudouridine synthase [Flavobacterium stagni]